MKNLVRLKIFFWGFLTLILLLFASCGSSGGGDFFAGAGFATIDTSPKVIDTGNRMQVRSEIGNTHPEGVMLKYRYPDALSYVADTAELRVDGNTKKIAPSIDIDMGNEMFLVFFFKQRDFGKDNYGLLTFELRANSALSTGKIEVDLDVDDILIENEIEFDLDNPEFTAIDSVNIRVID
jgi:hypothetical protein